MTKQNKQQLTVSPSLALIAEQLTKYQAIISKWFIKKWQETPAPLYGSVDLRNSGYKIAPVDMNLFPAGFNNLDDHAIAKAVIAATANIALLAPGTKNIALIPEMFTRNPWYWENINILIRILKQAGFMVKLATYSAPQSTPQTITLKNGSTLLLETLTANHNTLQVGDFIPDVLVLNNDLSSGIPTILQQSTQVLMPPAAIGWHARSKNQYFSYYTAISQEFAQILAIDPWLITPLMASSSDVDFLRGIGITELKRHTTNLLTAIKAKYQHYGIEQSPFVIIKADAGTHGMAVMSINNSKQLDSLNRQQRTAMARIKSNRQVNKVLIQEGVYTREKYGAALHSAEPVLYLWGQEVIGGFYRIHPERNNTQNLNSPGMYFAPLTAQEQPSNPYLLTPEYLTVSNTIAQLSMLAAAQEISAAS